MTDLVIKFCYRFKLIKYILPHDKDFFGLKKLKKKIGNNQIIDVGSAYGLSVLSIRKLGFKKNKIFCFEPNIYYKKFWTQNFLKENISIFFHGIYFHNKFCNLHIPKGMLFYNYTAGSIYKKCFAKYKTQKISLKVINQKLFKKVGLIKIDAEKSDNIILLCLEKVIRRDKPVILIEDNKELKFFVNFLQGYKLMHYRNNKFINYKKNSNFRNAYLIPIQ